MVLSSSLPTCFSLDSFLVAQVHLLECALLVAKYVASLFLLQFPTNLRLFAIFFSIKMTLGTLF